MRNENEEKLRELVKKWTNHFYWRKDFLKWQERRIKQENHQDKVIENLKQLFPNLKRAKILDLGCGMGGFLVAMKRLGYEIIGLDPNPEYLEIAKLRAKRYSFNLELIQGYGENLPFSDKSFDLVYCAEVLEHCQNPEKVLGEIYRVLKDDGAVYLTVANRFAFFDSHYQWYFLNWLPRFLGELVIKLKNIQKEDSLSGFQKLSHMHYFTFKSFQKLAEQKGFKIEDVRKRKLENSESISNKTFKKLATFLNKLKLSKIFYSIYQNYFLTNFILILNKNKQK